MKPASVSVTGMTRISDHITSIRAAEEVAKRKLTIREQVIQFALSKPYGFTDDNLKAAFPDSPESSYRKRRTELSDENIIVARGDDDINRAGQKETIWTHRDHMLFPPPIKARQPKPSRFTLLQEENARLRAEVEAAYHSGFVDGAAFGRNFSAYTATMLATALEFNWKSSRFS